MTPNLSHEMEAAGALRTRNVTTGMERKKKSKKSVRDADASVEIHAVNNAAVFILGILLFDVAAGVRATRQTRLIIIHTPFTLIIVLLVEIREENGIRVVVRSYPSQLCSDAPRSTRSGLQRQKDGQ